MIVILWFWMFLKHRDRIELPDEGDGRAEAESADVPLRG